MTASSPANPGTKLPKVGTTIFTVMSQLAMQHGAINLSQGFPDYDAPAGLLDAVARHLRNRRNQYAPMTGVPELRHAIADKVAALYHAQADPETDITITSGATEALFCAIQAIIRPGDEAIVLDPAYDSYEPAVTLAGGTTIHIPLQAPQPDAAPGSRTDQWHTDWAAVQNRITPRTRMIILNSPHNPTGGVFESADLDALQGIVARHDLYLLSDEVYEHMVFDGGEHQSLLLRPQLAERSFVVSSFGKTYHATGWKIAYCIAPPALTAELRKIHQYVTFTTNTPIQLALADFMRSDPQHILQLPAFYQHKRDVFLDAMQNSRFRLRPARGTYFQMADYSAISDMQDTDFCNWLTTECGIAAIPPSVFFETPPQTRSIRFCFAKDEATLQQAAEKLRAL